MLTAIVIYIGIGLVVGAIARFQQSHSSLAGVLGSGGVGGAIGGLFANLLFSDEIAVDGVGIAGAAILGIAAVLVVRIADRRDAHEESSAAPSEPTDD